MAAFLNDPLPIRTRKGQMDEDGYRDYWATFLVITTDKLDGPSVVLTCPGLPTPSSTWAVGNDNDPWAYATLERKVEQVEEGPQSAQWHVEIKYSSKSKDKRCKDQQVDDPLLVADRVSGGSHKYTEEATTDRFGNQLVNSAFEQIRGQQVEFDANRFTITIEQNVLDLQLYLLSTIVNCVNDSTLWGMPRRKVKLSDFDFEVKYYGNCYKYYTRKLTFDIDPLGFDRDLLDEGTKALNGQWGSDGHWQLINIGGQVPNPANPAHYTTYKDRKGQPGKVVLDGTGRPFDDSPTIQTGCSQCPSNAGGSLQVWTIRGYIKLSGDQGYSVVSVDLTYTSGCSWVGTSGGTTYTLTYSAPNWTLTTSGGVFSTVSWSAPGAPNFATLPPQLGWNCLGPNTLGSLVNAVASPISGTDKYPGSWIAYAKRTSFPGQRHVEKYAEANFLALGIPTSI